MIFIPASNEPSGHACMHIHDNRKLAFYCMATAAGVNTPQLCCGVVDLRDASPDGRGEERKDQENEIK